MSARVLWEGSFFSHHSLAVVNRELVLALRDRPDLDVTIRAGEDPTSFSWDPERMSRLAALVADEGWTPDVVVRHQWPLNALPPRTGKWVVIQPWEYGAIPRSWYETLRFGADEIWVPSSFNRDCYVEAGVPEGRVRVVPNAVQPVMLGEPRPFPLQTRKRFRFLFVGGTIPRKGIDLLLEAFTRAFTRDDDVCLVIKDFGADSFYRGQTYGSFIRELQRDPSAPEIEYLTEDLAPEQLRDLYHACHCLAQPYRGEGFGLPIAEAMACGLPVIVPEKGGSSDFCTPETAILLPSVRRPLPAALARSLNTRGHPWWMEVRVADLKARMRDVYEDADAFAAMAERGRRLVRERFTWKRSAELAARGIQGCESSTTPPLHRDADAQFSLRTEDGIAAWEQRNLPGALRSFAAARAWHETPDALFNVAAVLIASGDHRSAAEVTETLVRSALEGAPDPSLVAAACVLAATCRLELGRVDEARDAIEMALRHEPDHADALALRVEVGKRVRPDAPAWREERPLIAWRAPVFNGSGYADEMRNFVFGLRDLGWRMALDPLDEVKQNGVITGEEFDTLRTLVEPGANGEVHLQQLPPDATVAPTAPLSVLRTMFETDRILPEWAETCNRFTAVWVPTEFNRQTFVRSGVLAEKVRVVAGSLDEALYDPARHRPLPLRTRAAYRFLSVFDWQLRKGWDILLRSYFEEFSADDDVALVIKAGNTHTKVPPAEFIATFARSNGYTRTPAVEIVEQYLTTEEMISLYLACDAFVLPTRGEGWGRPYMEAMALGMPTIGTRWSGHLAFMNDENSFLIELDGLEPADGQGLPQFEGHLWASPSVASTRALMRQVHTDPASARRRGERARQDVTTRFSRGTVAVQLQNELMRLARGEA
jgi:glycosyltransferase involved in cell wall biosynthesis